MATNEKNTPNQAAPQGASSSARRRRRRSHHSGGSTQAQSGGQNGEKAAAAQPKKQSGGKAAANRQPSQNQGRKQNGRGSSGTKNTPAKAGQEPRSHRAAEPRRRTSAQEEDPGLVLITRRPPKQKFANFEEYIAAHGGVTAPIPGEEETDPDDRTEENR